MLKNKGIKTFINSLILKASVISYCDFHMDIQTLDYFSVLEQAFKGNSNLLMHFYLGRKLWNLIICDLHFFCLSRPSFWLFLKLFLKTYKLEFYQMPVSKKLPQFEELFGELRDNVPKKLNYLIPKLRIIFHDH
jgi:hypothetical protein